MIILLGLAGSGKSTQGQILAEKYGWQWISMGELIRQDGRFDDILAKGGLIDASVTEELLFDKLTELRARGEKVVLDGFPRSVEQADWLVRQGLVDENDVVMYLTVPREELMRRLLERQRADDNPETIEARFKVAEENIEQVWRILQGSGAKMFEVNGEGSIEEVTALVKELLVKQGMIKEN